MTSILVVEDEPLMAEAIKLQLVGCGYQVAALVSDGEGAVEQAQTLAPDLVLMDIVLAGKMDGIAAAQKIRESCDIPVLYLTAYADDEFFRRAKVTEPYAYLLKPSSPREIQLAIEIALYRHKTEKTVRELLEQTVAERTAELEHERRHLAALLDRISDAFVSLDENWRYTYVNAKAGVLLGRKPEELIGKHIWTEFPENVGQAFYHACQKAMAEQTLIEREEYYPSLGRWFENRIFPSKDGLCIFFHDITWRKLNEQALQDSERYNRMLFESLPTGLALCRMDGTMVDVNKAYASILGLTIEETLTLSYWDITPEKYAEQERAQLANLNTTGSYGPYEKEYIHKDGHLVPVSLYGRIIEKGGERYIWSSVKDITERKKAESVVRESEAKFRAIIEATPVPLALNDEQGNITYLNRAFIQTTGYTTDDIPTLKDWWPRAYPDPQYRQWVADSWQHNLEEAKHTGRPFSALELNVQCKNGSARTFMVSAAPLKGGFSETHLVILFDITERKQSEEQIRQQLDMLQALYAGAHKLSEALDISGVAASVAHLCVEVLGAQLAWLGRAEDDGRVSLLAHFPEEYPYPRSISVRWDDTPQGRGPTGRAIREGAPVFTEEIASDKNFAPWRDLATKEGLRSSAAFPLISRGKAFGSLNLYSTSPGYFTQARIALFQALAHQAAAALVNVTLFEEVRAYATELEQRVDERTADLNAINQELEAYSYSVSHDLRAPLRAMQGFSQALEEDYSEALGATGKDYVQRIVASARRMDALIQDLLDYSQLGRTEMQIKPVSLAAAIRDALAQLDSEIRQSAPEITVAPALPAVMAHAPTLTQIISNLLANAIKFVSPGCRPVVKVWAEERGERVRLWVEDNGIGIAPEHQARIFRVFERLHGMETYPGTGIGLAIVHKGAARMGGAAGVESLEGKGSRFWVELDKPLKAENP